MTARAWAKRCPVEQAHAQVEGDAVRGLDVASHIYVAPQGLFCVKLSDAPFVGIGQRQVKFAEPPTLTTAGVFRLDVARPQRAAHHRAHRAGLQAGRLAQRAFDVGQPGGGAEAK